MDPDSEDLDARESKKVGLRRGSFGKAVTESQLFAIGPQQTWGASWPECLRLIAVEVAMEGSGEFTRPS